MSKNPSDLGSQIRFRIFPKKRTLRLLNKLSSVFLLSDETRFIKEFISVCSAARFSQTLKTVPKKFAPKLNFQFHKKTRWKMTWRVKLLQQTNRQYWKESISDSPEKNELSCVYRRQTTLKLHCTWSSSNKFRRLQLFFVSNCFTSFQYSKHKIKYPPFRVGEKDYLPFKPNQSLTIILRNRAEYHLILSQRGRRPNWVSQVIFRKLEPDNCFITLQILIAYHFHNKKNFICMIKTPKACNK